MSMLADRRKRVKYCLNPNGNSWNNDDNKLGQKLLEKMGWTKGQGLGKSNQGITERLKVAYKFDAKGLGFKERDGTLQQQTEFQHLLNQFHKIPEHSHGINSVSSLEEKSRKSKSRVHYQKFTRGKDISRYSSKDLLCILGSANNSNRAVDIPSSERSDCLDETKCLEEGQNEIGEIIYGEDYQESAVCDEIDDTDFCKKKKKKQKKKIKHKSDIDCVENFQESENDINQGKAEALCKNEKVCADFRTSDTDSNEIIAKKKKHKKQKYKDSCHENSDVLSNPIKVKPNVNSDLSSIMSSVKFTHGKDISRDVDIPSSKRSDCLDETKYSEEGQNEIDRVINGEDYQENAVCNDKIDDIDFCKNKKKKQKKKINHKSNIDCVENFQESENDINQGKAEVLCNNEKVFADYRASNADSNEIIVKKKKHKKQKYKGSCHENSDVLSNPIKVKPNLNSDLNCTMFNDKKHGTKKRKLDKVSIETDFCNEEKLDYGTTKHNNNKNLNCDIENQEEETDIKRKKEKMDVINEKQNEHRDSKIDIQYECTSNKLQKKLTEKLENFEFKETSDKNKIGDANLEVNFCENPINGNNTNSEYWVKNYINVYPKYKAFKGSNLKKVLGYGIE